MKRAITVLPVLFIIFLTSHVLIQIPLAKADFTLELDASFTAGTLSLDFTIQTAEAATWSNFLILTQPSVQVIPLWSVPLPVIPESYPVPISFPFPSAGYIGIYSGLFTAEGAQAVDLAWIDTSCWDTDGDGYDDEVCGGDDCDDTDSDVKPGIMEGPAGDPSCSDGLDNDCDGATDGEEPVCISGEMVCIPAGEFVMGSDPGEGAADEMPEHVVWLSDYAIDIYAVTNLEFADFLNTYGSNISPEGYEMLDADDPDRHIYWDGSSWYAEAGYEDHPIIEVTWYGANTFCDYNGERLPTEAEFEKAARGGCELRGAPWACEDPYDERTYPWGEGIDCDYANYTGCVGDTTPVGSYPLGVSPYGAYDMAGNVWEWVLDWYELGYYDYSPYLDPQGPVSGTNRALHGGGSWIDGTYGMRVPRRWPYNPISSGYNIGFRCVRGCMPCADIDGDGYGAPSSPLCTFPQWDCDDSDPYVNPGATEGPFDDPTCSDGIDNDCDGLIDTDQECTPIHVPADYATIQGAIDAAVDGDYVLVAPGTYRENLYLHYTEVKIHSEAGADVTVIDGGQAGHVVKFTTSQTGESELDGFTIRNGYSANPFGDYGGGILCFQAANTLISNCYITENRAYLGGGISCEGSYPMITNCMITRNEAMNNTGGGFYCDRSSPIMLNCTISQNQGGGCNIQDSSPSFTNCTIAENIPRESDPRSGGGGLSFNDSFPILIFCTVTENRSTWDGGGIRCDPSSFPTLTNCIVWNNISTSSSQDIHGSVDASYSDIKYGWPGIGNIDLDPLFVGSGDYHLTVESPCIDAGIDASVHEDIDGDVRPILAGFDMGADEYAGPCWDGDGDSYGDEMCSGDDCDDADPSINPGADEVCDDEIDNDCDGFIDRYDLDCPHCIDLDGDGYGDPASSECAFPQWDCDDSDPYVNPGAQEGPQTSSYCSDGIDNDCDGLSDASDPDCAP